MRRPARLVAFALNIQKQINLYYFLIYTEVLESFIITDALSKKRKLDMARSVFDNLALISLKPVSSIGNLKKHCSNIKQVCAVLCRCFHNINDT